MWREFNRRAVPKLGQFRGLRDVALVGLGLRCMLRGADLRMLRADAICFDGQRCSVACPGIKRGPARVLPLDEVAGGIVAALREWIQYRAGGLRAVASGTAYGLVATSELAVPSAIFSDGKVTWQVSSEWMFCSEAGRQLSSAHVTEIVRRAAQIAGVANWHDYTGHCLRRGGATAAYAGNVSDIAVRSVGAWKSDAVMLYVNQECSAALHVGERMGL